MFKKLNDKDRKRLKRKIHIRKHLHGTAARPRMTVTRSNKNLFVQVINDEEGKTLAAISTLEKIQFSIYQALETKRMGFPRLYFISDSQFINLIAHSKEALSLRPYLPLLFVSIKAIVSKIPLSSSISPIDLNPLVNN